MNYILKDSELTGIVLGAVLWSAVESQLQHFTGEIAKIQKKLVYCGLLGWITVYHGTASITPTTGTEHSSDA
jgi:hypothetical protein